MFINKLINYLKFITHTINFYNFITHIIFNYYCTSCFYEIFQVKPAFNLASLSVYSDYNYPPKYL